MKLLVRTAPDGGTIRVHYAGHHLGLLHLTSPHTRDRVLTVGNFRHRQSGAVRIRIVRRGPVRIDGLAALR